MNKQFLCTALASLLFVSLFAQSFGEIHGKVLDDKGKPAFNVAVTAGNGISATVGDYTDERGVFKIKPLQVGTYTVNYKSVEFSPAIQEGVIVSPDQITFLKEVNLNSINLDPIIITTYTVPLIDQEGFKPITLRTAELKNMSAANGGDLKTIALATTSDIKSNRDGSELYFRGSRSGSVIYYIDGIKIRENPPRMPSSGISSFSVYTGGMPAKYGDSTGGIIVVETKNYMELYYDKLNEN